VEACDELILWFGDGPYVERALELKMLYQPLTKAQEDKYRGFRMAKEGITHIEDNDKAVNIPQVTLPPERFNTVNLQEEIAKGMQQIIDAKEKSTVNDTMSNIKKIVGDIPFLQTSESEEEHPDRPHIETDEEIDGSLKINFQELLGEDSDGQISMVVDEQTQLERQITGQMTIADVLEEWEKTKRAAETAMQEAEQRRLESAKAKALQEAGDIMERLSGVIPVPVANPTPTVAPVSMEIPTPSIGNGMHELMPSEPEMEIDSEEEVEAIAEIETESEAEEIAEIEAESDSEAEDEVEIEDEAETEDEDESASVLEEAPALNDNPVLTQDTIRYPDKLLPKAGDTSKLPEIALPEEIVEEVKEVKKAAEPIKKMSELTAEQRAIFSYFVPVKGMESQLCETVNNVVAHLKMDVASNTGNVIIQGGRECGKTVLATSLIRVLQKETNKLGGKIGKINAEALNRKDVQGLLGKVAGGVLIIESAGDIDHDTALKLALLLSQDKSGTLVIMEDTSKGIKKALAQDASFAACFTEKITVPIFTNDELVSFAKSYATELGYKIDEMAVLALYNRISNIQKLDQATTLAEVKEIVDEAIERERRGGLKKAMSIVTASRYTDDDRIVLKERVFD